MVTAYKTLENKLNIVDNKDSHNWINIINPSKEELVKISEDTGALLEFLEAPLDSEERPRIDVEDNQVLLIINIPIEEEEGETGIIYNTIPLGIIIVGDHFITVCLEETNCLQDFIMRSVKSLSTLKKTRLALQIFYRTSIYYLKFLKFIDRKTGELERALHGSMQNEQLIKLLGLEKSLVYFTTSLKANEIVMKKIFRTNVLPMYEEDEDLLEDVLTETRQAIEMSEINSNILTGLMDAFASIISNNLNNVMKILAGVTIILSIPTMVFSFFGMNVPIPFETQPIVTAVIFIVSIMISASVWYLMRKKNML
ncbi:MAG: magnesium transporter CorA family protein [Firmicutes bacterium]|nr:magnesium transporter CorA family protein [Bacillota bacterium]